MNLDMLKELAALASDTDCKFCEKFKVACPFSGMTGIEKEELFFEKNKDDIKCEHAIQDKIMQELSISFRV